MTLEVHFRGGPRAGQTAAFDDKIERIAFGRDAERCQVVFPPDEPRVGREHFAVSRQLGRYRLVLNDSDALLVNGKAAVDGQELPERAEVQLGRNGPQLVLLTQFPGQLPPTVGRVHQAGAATRLVWAERSARFAKRIGLVTAAVLLVALPGGYYAWRSIGDSSDARLHTALEQARPSVYLVMRRGGDDSLDTVATAWVVDQARGLLATNAHVAEGFQNLGPDEKLLVRSPESPPRDFEISDVRLHPGYAQSIALWGDYQPVVRIAANQLEDVQSPGPACDVALLIAANSAGLAAALPLAPLEELNSIEAMYPIGYVGYPMEGLALGGVNVDAPSAASHIAYVVARTTYFDLTAAPDAERLLVQHALPLAGGSSGSPVLNAKGQVVAVASGANVVGKVDLARVASSANIGFAQRVDLVTELIDRTAGALQGDRTAAWKQQIAKYYGRRVDLEQAVKLDELADSALQTWKTGLEQSERLEAQIDLVAKYRLQVPSPTGVDPGEVSQSFLVTQQGDCLLVAAGSAALSLKLTATDSQGAARSYAGDGAAAECQTVATALPAGAQCEVQVSSSKPQKIVLRCYRAQVHSVGAEERFEQQAQKWIRRLQQTASNDLSSSIVRTDSLTSATTSEDDIFLTVADLGELASGDYLLVVVPSGNDELDLDIVAGPNTSLVSLANDRLTRAWAACEFNVPESILVRAGILGKVGGSKFDLRLYRAQ